MENSPSPDTPVAEIDFKAYQWITAKMDTRVRNGLQRAGIMTLGQLLEQTEPYLRDEVQGLGVVSVEVIKWKLKSLGLKLKK